MIGNKDKKQSVVIDTFYSANSNKPLFSSIQMRTTYWKGCKLYQLTTEDSIYRLLLF